MPLPTLDSGYHLTESWMFRFSACPAGLNVHQNSRICYQKSVMIINLMTQMHGGKLKAVNVLLKQKSRHPTLISIWAWLVRAASISISHLDWTENISNPFSDIILFMAGSWPLFLLAIFAPIILSHPWIPPAPKVTVLLSSPQNVHLPSGDKHELNTNTSIGNEQGAHN